MSTRCVQCWCETVDGVCPSCGVVVAVEAPVLPGRPTCPKCGDDMFGPLCPSCDTLTTEQTREVIADMERLMPRPSDCDKCAAWESCTIRPRPGEVVMDCHYYQPRSWCPHCGPSVPWDEDGCCQQCGADCTGEGADLALRVNRAAGGGVVCVSRADLVLVLRALYPIPVGDVAMDAARRLRAMLPEVQDWNGRGA